jgi:hypothetical protein
MSEAKTMTLEPKPISPRRLRALAQTAGPTIEHHFAMLQAATALEAAEKALEPFAKHGAYLEEENLSGHVVHTGPLKFVNFIDARTVHSMLRGE